jgi:hypothetical protein
MTLENRSQSAFALGWRKTKDIVGHLLKILLFVHFCVIVQKLASKTVTTCSFFPKRFTFPCSISFFRVFGRSNKFMWAMSELTFSSVRTKAHFGIIFTHLGFELNEICFVCYWPMWLTGTFIIGWFSFGGFIVRIGFGILYFGWHL